MKFLNRPVLDKLGSVYDVRDWSVVGDGTTDDTTNFQSAVNTLGASGVGGTLVIPRGLTLKLTDFITLSGLTNLTIRGEGAKITQATSSKSVFQITNGSSNITISGLTLVGNHPSPQAAVGDGAGILIGSYTAGDGGTTKKDITVQNCKISNFTHAGILMYGQQSGSTIPTNQNIKVIDNRITGCQNGVFIYKNARDVVISDNSIDGCWYDGIICDTKTTSDTEVAQPNYGVTISGNTLRNTGTYGSCVGILVKGENKAISVTGNTLYDTGVNQSQVANVYGILVMQEASANAGHNVTVADNAIYNVQGLQIGFGIQVSDYSNVTVSGNTVSDIKNYGIYIYNAKNTAVTGNTVLRVGSNAITVTGTSGSLSTNCTVAGNTIRKDTGAGTNGIVLDYADTVGVVGNAAADYTTSRITRTTNTLNMTSLGNGACDFTPAVTLTDGATISTNAALGNLFRVVLGGNRTMAAPTNPSDGQKITYEITQDSTGSRTITWNSVFAFGTDVPSPTLTTTALKKDFVTFIYHANAVKWFCIDVVRGY
jgi:parallel beta-helix repeat protein